MQRLTWPSRISYGIGAFGKDLVYAIVATFYMFYLTDICKISPIFVGNLFLVARIFDAVNDPIMGLIVDNTHTRWGKFRPWILLGTLLNAIVLFFLFFNPGLDAGQQLAYIAVTYILWGVTYTLMDIPYWSMVPALTDDEKERDTISVIPHIFASAAWMLIGYLGLPLVKLLGAGSQPLGFTRLGAIIAGIFFLCLLVTFFFVREQVSPRQVKREHTSVREMLRILGKNDQVIVVLVLALLFNLSFQLSNGFAVFYFKYAIGVQDLVSCYLLAAGLAQLAGLFGYPFFAAKFGRKTVFAASGILPVAGFLVLLLACFPAEETLRWWSIFLTGAVINLGIGFSLGILTVMLADVVDYGEFKLGTRNESSLFSTQTFVVKLAGALSGFISGAGLSCIGFVADAVQPPAAVLGIRIIMGGIPILFSVIYLLIYWRFYRLNGSYLQEVRRMPFSRGISANGNRRNCSSTPWSGLPEVLLTGSFPCGEHRITMSLWKVPES